MRVTSRVIIRVAYGCLADPDLVGRAESQRAVTVEGIGSLGVLPGRISGSGGARSAIFENPIK